MELNMDKKVYVKNLRSWDVYFNRSQGGTVKIAENGKMLLTRTEIEYQCYSNNKLFTGDDGLGSHATLLIEDKDTRILVGFETEDFTNENGEKEKGKIQTILSDDILKKIFAYKTLTTFKEKIVEYVATESEKKYIADNCIRLGLNDYNRIQFIKEHTGLKIKE
jgi:hypothetical protein